MSDGLHQNDFCGKFKVYVIFRDVRPSRDTSGSRTRGGGRGDRGRGVDRGKRGHISHLVQTQGLFSEGAGAVNVKRQMTRCKFRDSLFELSFNLSHLHSVQLPRVCILGNFTEANTQQDRLKDRF